jgi:hypothetical protein
MQAGKWNYLICHIGVSPLCSSRSDKKAASVSKGRFAFFSIHSIAASSSFRETVAKLVA